MNKLEGSENPPGKFPGARMPVLMFRMALGCELIAG